MQFNAPLPSTGVLPTITYTTPESSSHHNAINQPCQKLNIRRQRPLLPPSIQNINKKATRATILPSSSKVATLRDTPRATSSNKAISPSITLLSSNNLSTFSSSSGAVADPRGSNGALVRFHSQFALKCWCRSFNLRNSAHSKQYAARIKLPTMMKSH